MFYFTRSSGVIAARFSVQLSNKGTGTGGESRCLPGWTEVPTVPRGLVGGR